MPLPSVLSRPPQPLDPAALDSWRVGDLRRLAGTWLERGRGAKVPSGSLVGELKRAVKDAANVARLWEQLSASDRNVLGVYARHGGTLDGRVAFLELRARGLIRLVKDTWSRERVERNPLQSLGDRRLLMSERGHSGYYYFSSYGIEGQFPTLGIVEPLMPHVTPAGPPTWTVRPAGGEVEPLSHRPPALVALGLARTYATLTAGLKIRLNRSGEISIPSMRTLEKALGLHIDTDWPLADAAAFWFELLRALGLVTAEEGQMKGDEAAAGELFGLPEVELGWRWARAWLALTNWSDGTGVRGSDPYESADGLDGRRQILTWALGCLAHVDGAPWFGLEDFLHELREILGPLAHSYGDYGSYAWEPNLAPARGKERKDGEERMRAYWFAGPGTGYANALLITLAELGLVERGRLGRDGTGTLCFRLTPLGRGVFGAPEIERPSAAAGQKFLVVQPNFDVVAYLDRADAGSAALLGRVAEADARQTGPVQTFRLTHAAFYRALEGGTTPEAVLGFLRDHNQGDLPPNVLRSLAEWSAQRERLVLRSGVTLRAFPSTTQRDAWLKDNDGRAFGDRFALITTGLRAARASRLTTVDHRLGGRQTFVLDEHGRLQTAEPIDLLQTARLRRLAEPTPDGWRLTAESLAAAQRDGLRGPQIRSWLAALLREPMPPLMEVALDAWTGSETAVELGDAVVLHVPDLAAFEALAASVRFRDFVLASLGPGWFLIRKERRKELLAMLQELGLSVGKEVKLGGP